MLCAVSRARYLDACRPSTGASVAHVIPRNILVDFPIPVCCANANSRPLPHPPRSHTHLHPRRPSSLSPARRAHFLTPRPALPSPSAQCMRRRPSSLSPARRPIRCRRWRLLPTHALMCVIAVGIEAPPQHCLLLTAVTAANAHRSSAALRCTPPPNQDAGGGSIPNASLHLYVRPSSFLCPHPNELTHL